MTNFNAALLCDGYKLDHRRQYPPGTTRVYSNWTPRGSRTDETEVVCFGLQAFIQQHIQDNWNETFFERDEDAVVARYTRRVNAYLGPNQIGEQHIRDLHRLGYMPLEFKALPEGTSSPLRVPQITVESTHPDFFWLVNYIESLMSCCLWQPSTSATTARAYRRLLEGWAAVSGTDPEFVDWQAHDFSFRGMPGPEAAAASAAGHLTFFTGTDTLPALDWIEQYYKPENIDALAGSVAATEHSVMCAGSKDAEFETFERLLDLYPTGILSIVSDTWDLWKVLTEYLPRLKDKILARDGKIVIRPDSGDPVKILCGDHAAVEGSPQRKGVIQLLWDVFGGTVVGPNSERLLDPHIGAIYGDAITLERADEICDQLFWNDFASGNVVFGIGSFTYQYVTRDTYGFAMKATWAEVDGEGRDLFKDPITDSGEKRSARGRLAVLEGRSFLPSGLGLECVEQATPEQEAQSQLELVWRDGIWHRYHTFEEVRRNARS